MQPALEGDVQTTIWSVAGPVIFSVVAWLMYSKYEKVHQLGKQKQKQIS